MFEKSKEFKFQIDGIDYIGWHGVTSLTYYSDGRISLVIGAWKMASGSVTYGGQMAVKY